MLQSLAARFHLSPAFVIGDHMDALPPAAAVTTSPSHITVNEQAITLGPDSIIITGTTMKPGHPSITSHCQPISVVAFKTDPNSVTTDLSLQAAIATRESSYTTLNGGIMDIVDICLRLG